MGVRGSGLIRADELLWRGIDWHAHAGVRMLAEFQRRSLGS
jgi:hypothetical protein